MKTTRSTINIAFYDGPLELKARLLHGDFEGLAVHRPHNDQKSWTVTHVASGLRLGGLTTPNLKTMWRVLEDGMKKEKVDWTVSHKELDMDAALRFYNAAKDSLLGY